MEFEEAKKRSKSAFANQDLWRDLLEDAYFYSIPERNNFTRRTEGNEEDDLVYDETAPVALPKFANRMQRALFPDAEQWVNFKSGTEVGQDDEEQVNRDLEEYTNTFFDFFNQTNFYTEITPSFMDCAVSTGVIQIEEEAITSDKVATWINIPLNEIAFEKPLKGRLVNSWRRFKLELGVIKKKWPKAKIPQKLEEMIQKDPMKEEDLLMGHIEKDKKFSVVVFWDKHMLIEETFNTQRIIAFRLNAFPRETLGRGPAILALPVIRDLNVMQQLILENGAINVAGMYTARTDSVFNPYTFTVTAGGVIPVKSNDNSNPTIRRLENSGDLGMGQLIIEDKQESVRKAFFVDPLGDFSDPVRSATEQTMRMQEFLKDEGASIHRLRTELVEQVILSFVDILQSRGKLPSIKVDGKSIKIVHNTQLIRAEKQDEYNSLLTWLSAIGSSLGPEVLLGTVKVEEVPEGMAEMLGVSSRFLRDQAETAALVDTLRGALGEQANSEALPADQ